MRTQENILTDSIFLMAFASDLMIQDLNRRMRANGNGIRECSKFNLNELNKALKRVSYFADKLWQELFDAEEENNWKNVQVWQDEANELARLILLWQDREKRPDICNEIFKFIRSTEGEGVVNEDMLKQYYLIKHV